MMYPRSAISSHSLGRAWIHPLEAKLDAASDHNLDLELFYEDVEYVARTLPGGISNDNLIEAATIVKHLCDERGMNIICLQPFMHYEGLRDRQKHAARIEEMKIWLRLVAILDTQLIGIPSSFLPREEISGDFDLIVSDLREVADLGIDHGITFSYEALCWGTYVNTWEQAWEVVQAVDRPNFGLCLDTFNMAGKFYADPEAQSGKTLTATADLAATLHRLREIDIDRVFCLQVVDAARLEQPISPAHPYYDEKQASRMSWSRNCRLFYGETDLGAYLPIAEILQVILSELQYKGPISAELFNACLVDTSATLPQQLAQRAATSWRKLVEDFDLEVKPAFTNDCCELVCDDSAWLSYEAPDRQKSNPILRNDSGISFGMHEQKPSAAIMA